MPVEFSPMVGRKPASFLFLLLEEAGQMDEPLPAAGGRGSICFVMVEGDLCVLSCLELLCRQAVPKAQGSWLPPVRPLGNLCFRSVGPSVFPAP